MSVLAYGMGIVSLVVCSSGGTAGQLIRFTTSSTSMKTPSLKWEFPLFLLTYTMSNLEVLYAAFAIGLFVFFAFQYKSSSYSLGLQVSSLVHPNWKISLISQKNIHQTNTSCIIKARIIQPRYFISRISVDERGYLSSEYNASVY